MLTTNRAETSSGPAKAGRVDQAVEIGVPERKDAAGYCAYAGHRPRPDDEDRICVEPEGVTANLKESERRSALLGARERGDGAQRLRVKRAGNAELEELTGPGRLTRRAGVPPRP